MRGVARGVWGPSADQAGCNGATARAPTAQPSWHINASSMRTRRCAWSQVRDRFKNARAVDYNAEVPFELKPRAGFYTTEEEEQITRNMQQVGAAGAGRRQSV